MRKLLYVEDDPCQAMLDIPGLKVKGFEVYHASDYEKARKMLYEDKPFELYIIDGEFPRKPRGNPEFLAREMVAEIRNIDPNALIVCQSRSLNLEGKLKGLNVIPKNKSEEMATEWINQVIQDKK